VYVHEPETKTVRTRFEHANPILNVANLARSVRYYVDTLGFTNAEWGGDDFTCVTRDGATIYLSEDDQGQSGTWVWLGAPVLELVLKTFEDIARGEEHCSFSAVCMLRCCP